MDNTINNPVSYSGVVTIKIQDTKSKKIISSRVIKNAGTKYLFEFLCNCLTGTFDNQKYPRYLDASDTIINAETANTPQEFNSALYFRSILTSSNVLEIPGYTILNDGGNTPVGYSNFHSKFSCTIMLGQIKTSTSGAAADIKALALCNSPSSSDNTSSILAWVNLLNDTGEAAGIQIDNNQAILIEWDMCFNNYISNEQKIQNS